MPPRSPTDLLSFGGGEQLTVLEGLLLLERGIIVMRVHGVDIQGHVPAAAFGEASLRVDDGVAARGRLDQIRVLLLEEAEVAFGLPVPGAVGREQQVHFLEGALTGLGVEGPDHGEGDDVGGGEDVVGLLLEGLEHDGQKEGEPAVSDGPANHSPGVSFSADLEREDLGGVEPGHGEPGGAEGGGEQEDHGDGAGAVASGGRGAEGMVLTHAGETPGEEHGDALDDRAPVEGPATADSVECEDADEGGHHVGDGVETGDPLDLTVADTGCAEDGGSVDGDTGDTDPFLHDLEPNDELNTATGVEFAGADAKEHGEVGLCAGGLAFELGDVADILEFGFGLAHILAGFATEATEDVACLFLATNLGEPTGRLGEEPHNGEQEEKGNNLESNRESPDKRPVASGVE